MNKLLITIGFCIMVAVQWYVPGAMILDQETALTKGTPYKFKTRPIDPNDPFRGKYVWLDFELDSAETSDTLWERKEPIYVYIKTGIDGYAEATQVSKTPLNIDQDFVKAVSGYYYTNKLRFDLPFDRFYMEESKALEAESGIRSTMLRRSDSLAPVCYALVYVKGPTAVLDNVFIGETSLKDFVLEERAENSSKIK